jgi:hypothetical protein
MKVHLVFKTHLDIGYTDFSKAVEERYFKVFIPGAIRLTQTFRDDPQGRGFVWTTGSWLVYEFLERAARPDRLQLEKAIQAGQIRWHALPFSTHSELMDPSLFRFGLSLSASLDRRFGVNTTAAKMTDVPGHTRGIVPLLAQAGVRFLHLGVNSACKPPRLPRLFTWRERTSRAEVAVMLQKGYGGSWSSPALGCGLMFAHTNDNQGPPSFEDVCAAWEEAQTRYRGAHIKASTLDGFAKDLLQGKPSLPRVDQEMGDTWIHGAASDPQKLAGFRALSRLRQVWERSGLAAKDRKRVFDFSRSLMMVPEHTWGMDIKTHLADRTNYPRPKFEAVRKRPNFRKVEGSWKEQRDYLKSAVAALGRGRLASQAIETLQELKAKPFSLKGARGTEPGKWFQAGKFEVRLNAADGSLEGLKLGSRVWADASHVLGRFWYQTFSPSDYRRLLRQYALQWPAPDWYIQDLSKVGLKASESPSRTWRPALQECWTRKSAQGTWIWSLLKEQGPAWSRHGCPGRIGLEFFFPSDRAEVRFDLRYWDKPANRHPEALWLSFNPVAALTGWTMDKLGVPVSPLEVAPDGNRHLHGIGEGLAWKQGKEALSLRSLDAAVVAPGKASLLDFQNSQPDLRQGWQFNLFNNVWNTNFPMWNEEDARFRFVLKFP